MSTATQTQPSTTFHTSPAVDPSTAQSQATQADAQRASANTAQFPPQAVKDASNPSQNSQNAQPQQNGQQNQDQNQQQQQSAAQPTLPQQGQPLPMSGPAASLMQLRSEIPPAPPLRNTRKRKSPATLSDAQAPQPPPQPQPQQVQAQPGQPQPLPPHPLGAPPPGVYPGLAYPYPPPADYAAAGLPPPPHMQQQMPGAPPQMQPPLQPGSADQPKRQLSTSKRAEQNRKAQRAFRERRDQHVRALESRSQLLDAALASADEANRRWEECRALVDQLRIENTALRTALQQAQQALGAAGVNVAAVVKNANGKEGEGDQTKQQQNQQSAPSAAENKEGS